MRSLVYPLARARRVRAPKRAFGPYPLLLCAGLAFIFMGPDEGRNPGSAPMGTLEVTPAQAMVPSPRRPILLPIDRVMSVPAEASAEGLALDIWSTRFPVEEAEAEPAVAPEARGEGDFAKAEAEPGPPGVLFEHTSLIEQPISIDGQAKGPSAAAPSLPAPLSLKSLAGRWAPHPAACPGRGRGSSYLPLTLDERGAKAGNASCSFRRTEQDGSRWRVAATCTDAKESWNANVRLALAGNKLTWSSEKGSQTYTRCP